MQNLITPSTPISPQNPSRGGKGVTKFFKFSSKMHKSSFHRARSELCRIWGKILTPQSRLKTCSETSKNQGPKKTLPRIFQNLVPFSSNESELLQDLGSMFLERHQDLKKQALWHPPKNSPKIKNIKEGTIYFLSNDFGPNFGRLKNHWFFLSK